MISLVLLTFRFDEGTREFILDHYLPEIQKATAHMLPLSPEEKSKLRGNVIGTLMKLGYAFLWQVMSMSQMNFFFQ